MPRERIRSRLLAGGQAVVDVPPMVGRGVSRIDLAGFDGVDRPQSVVDLGSAIDAQKNLGRRDVRTAGSNKVRPALPSARCRSSRRSSRSRWPPSARKRRRRRARNSRRAAGGRQLFPRRCGRSGSNARFASRAKSARHESDHLFCSRFGSEWVSSPSLRASIMFGEFAREQRAQHVGDGQSALKGGDLDAAALSGSDVDREPCGVETWLRISRQRGLRAAHPGFGIARAGRRRRAWDRVRS